MPRPKRSRRAAAPATAAEPTDSMPPPPSSDPTSDIYSHSDREHERLRKEQAESTRLSLADNSIASRLGRTPSLRQKKALEDASRSRDLAIERLAAEDVTTSIGNPADSSMDKSDASIEMGRRAQATPAQRRDTTGLDLDDDVFGVLDTSFEDDTSKAGQRSAETSSLNMSQFRRRPRAPSIVGRDDGPIRPSSRGVGTPSISSTFNIGVFKRRAREPSILGTAQKEKAQRPAEDSSSDLDLGNEDEDEEEEDFAPEAESTPLNRRKTQPAVSAEPEDERQSSSRPNTRKRKSVESHEANERPEKASRLDSDAGEDEVDSDLSSLPSPLARAFDHERPVTPMNEDEILAPPASSGSEDDNEAWPDIRTLAKKRRRISYTTPLQGGAASDVSSPPSLTHSPNFPATRAQPNGRKRQPSPKVTTADLTGMLPRRRHKKINDPFALDTSDNEIDTSGLAQDEDELSYLDARAARLRRGRTPLNRGASASRPPSRGGRAAQSAVKAKQTPLSNQAVKRTYSRRLSDKENQGDDTEGDSFAPAPDDTFDSLNTAELAANGGDELKNAAKKFKEVDKWELEFEEVTESSSPRDAR